MDIQVCQFLFYNDGGNKVAVITAENLHHAIEQKRDELYEIASQHSWTSPEVIHISQELDTLITRHVLLKHPEEQLIR
ncbi:aspartyl-phosphate phosphatase Spo0E family protein [Exiguobacterium alkaliphilum]|uniref:Aspartyl-phosphate phosphatase Spo0E family protein n=1 Tax=Exiguobacterium alkaliphilum TaxID=1428684 RepID=A0ABT2KXI2_9BACL|nr:aspartyl-phosphate phosphatase Spo0E family protein [Exiguobacterium alkaliphilum]